MNNIIVGNLGPNVSEQDMRSRFESYGRIRRSKIMTDRWTGLSRGFGFIQMRKDAAAEQAIAALNGIDFNGKALKVGNARPQIHRAKPSASIGSDIEAG